MSQTKLESNSEALDTVLADVQNLPSAGVPTETLALVRQLLGKAVYTEDVTADLAALDALLGGGELPDEPVVPPDEPEVVTEALTTGYIAERYPDITTFAYTEKVRNDNDYNPPFIFPSTIGGGVLSVDFDVSRCVGFQMMFFLFGPDGAPYKLGIGAGPNLDTSISTAARPSVGDNLAGGMSTVNWNKDPGTTPGWTGVGGPFTLSIPDGCNIMIAVQMTGFVSSDGSVTNSSITFSNLWDSGWLTAKITKEV